MTASATLPADKRLSPKPLCGWAHHCSVCLHLLMFCTCVAPLWSAIKQDGVTAYHRRQDDIEPEPEPDCCADYPFCKDDCPRERAASERIAAEAAARSAGNVPGKYSPLALRLADDLRDERE